MSEKELRAVCSKRLEDLSMIGMPSSGKIIDVKSKIVEVKYSQPQRHHDKKMSFTQVHLGSKILSTIPSASTTRYYDRRQRKTRNGDTISVSFTSSEEKSGTKKWSAEIWNEKSGVIKNIPLPEIHGDVITSFPFSMGVSWSSDQSKFLYLAEKKSKKTKHFWDVDVAKKENDDPKKDDEETEGEDHEEEEKDDFQEKYIYEDGISYGELLDKVKHPHVFECDWKNGSVRQIPNIPSHIACAHPFYSTSSNESDNERIYFVGYDIRNFKLGIISCIQRPSQLFEVSDSECKTVIPNTEEQWNVISPVVSPDGKKIVYFNTKKVPHHFPCVQLRKIDLTKQNPFSSNEVIIDIVEKLEDWDNSFPGLFPQSLMKEFCWSNDSKYIYCESCWKSDIAIIRINVDTGTIKRVSVDDSRSSYFLLDQVDNYILFSQQKPNHPYSIFLARFGDDDDDDDKLEDITLIEDCRTTLSKNEIIDPYLENVGYEVRTVVPSDCKDLPFEIIVVKPISEKTRKLPVIMVPHGGPHSLLPTRFISQCVYNVSFGMVMVLVNYRGSRGFGQTTIEKLSKNVGDWDVKDVISSLEFVKKEYTSEIDPEKIAVIGGSHGGFLCLHLIGQYPEVFKAAVTRNPVTDISSMVTATDIPDWSFTESGFDFTRLGVGRTENKKSEEDGRTGTGTGREDGSGLIIDEKFLITAFRKSPMRYIRNVTTPLLMLIGQKDLRVPISQGMFYYRSVKRLGKIKDAKMKIYPDCSHPLGKVVSSGDVWISSILWMLKHLEMEI